MSRALLFCCSHWAQLYLPRGPYRTRKVSGPSGGARHGSRGCVCSPVARRRYSLWVVKVVKMIPVFSSSLVPTCADKQKSRDAACSGVRAGLGPRSPSCDSSRGLCCPAPRRTMFARQSFGAPSQARARRGIAVRQDNCCDSSRGLCYPATPESPQARAFSKSRSKAFKVRHSACLSCIDQCQK